ncbi:MAG: acyl-CoA thioesterase [Pseudomonadota bacterium]
MSRHARELSAGFDFATDITVQARDINYGGHLGHDAAVSLLHEARRRWLAAAGYDEAGRDGAGLIMVELEVRYAAEAFWGDRLRIEMAVTGPGPARCEFRYRVTRGEHEVLRARTLMGFFDYSARRLTRRPADFLTRLTTLSEERNHV